MNKGPIQAWSEKHNPSKVYPQIISYSLLKRIPFGLKEPRHLEILESSLPDRVLLCSIKSRPYRKFN